MNQICGKNFRHEKTRIKFAGCRFVTKKAAAEKFHTFSSRKNMNQICRMPFRREKSRRRKISCVFVTKKHESNLQEAVSSRQRVAAEKFHALSS
jgi:hypothetical protein